MPRTRFRAVFSDIGGVLGTNGWDGPLRTRVCEQFGVTQEEIEEKHRLTFDSFERGFIKFDDYLKEVFFGQPRAFTPEALRAFICDASTPWPENLDLLRRLRSAGDVKVGLISNEGDGLAQHRVRKFRLGEICDFMVISYFIHLRKPDPAIWQIAADLAGVSPEEAIYIDDRELFAQTASRLGFTGIHHTSLQSTRQQLGALGLEITETK